MSNNTRVYWLHALSPTHAGIGRGVGYIDLPIDRDGVTNWPIIRGSAFKGVWRDWAEQRRLADLDRAFGRADKDGETANSGSLIPTDARLVCLPSRSFRGTFAWTTSPLCLRMLRRTLDLAGIGDLPDAPGELAEVEAHHHEKKTVLKQSDCVYLEDLDFKAIPCPIAAAWAEAIAGWVFPNDPEWRDVFIKRFVVIPDDPFNFLCETGTEVHARVRLDDESKTVARGALWSEESLPAETILAGFVQCDRVFGGDGREIQTNGLLDQFTGEPLHLQIGGKATVGRGRVRCVFTRTSGGDQ